jgi:transcriptional regulator with XRE-family HTH domain
MLTTEKINPQMVTIARESRGFVHLDLAEKLNISKSAAWRLEQESRTTHDDIIPKLSKLLKYPEGFFFQKGEVLPLSLSYRKRNVVAAKLMSSIEANINIYRLNMEQFLNAIK